MLSESETIRKEDYTALGDFVMEVEVGEEESLNFAFWLYIVNSESANFPAVIMEQDCFTAEERVPFVIVHENSILEIVPLLPFKADAFNVNSPTYFELQKQMVKFKFASERWIHIGFDVSENLMLINVNGNTFGDQYLPSTVTAGLLLNRSRKLTLVGGSGLDSGWKGYVYKSEGIPLKLLMKDSPSPLSIEESTSSDDVEDTDGLWTIAVGKASCSKIFSLDVVLHEATGKAVNNELKIVASLVYADDRQPVADDEASLLTYLDGIEFLANDRPRKLINGCASFNLKISKISSKCDGKLFCIKFQVQRFEDYHFLETFSNPIRCISRSSNPGRSSANLKRSMFISYDGTSGAECKNKIDCIYSKFCNNMNASSQIGLVRQEIGSTLRVIEGEIHKSVETNTLESYGAPLEEKSISSDVANASSCGSERMDDENFYGKEFSEIECLVSDSSVFKYCLGGLTDRALLLKGIAASVSEGVLSKLADDVSLYSGCCHHRPQILISKGLITDGMRLWNFMSQSGCTVHWDNAVQEIGKQFTKIARSSARYLTKEDFKLLKIISGSQEYMTSGNFEKMWCWLYPVAITLSRDLINRAWCSLYPKWIQGFITKEEAEMSLRDSHGLLAPGTFILRFPTSRSWPHPDAGNLIVTYVGSDYAIHHRLLSLDYILSDVGGKTNAKSLQEILLEDPALSQLGGQFDHRL